VLVAYVLSIHLQPHDFRPGARSGQVARDVSESRRFSIRAHKQTDDEFGTLVDGFNGMLSELERRDLNLRMYQNELEKRVRERTVSLDQPSPMRRRRASAPRAPAREERISGAHEP